MADLVHVPVIKQMTRIQNLHRHLTLSGFKGVQPGWTFGHITFTFQGIINGTNMVLADFHLVPQDSLVYSLHALPFEELSLFLIEVRLARDIYEKRKTQFSQTT